MGQLETYTIQDIFLVAILSGVLSTYFAEEIEATIESIAAYTYSANSFSKKRVALVPIKCVAGTSGDATHFSFNLLFINETTFLPIEKPIDKRRIWEDQFLYTWNSAVKDKIFAHLEEPYKNSNA